VPWVYSWDCKRGGLGVDRPRDWQSGRRVTVLYCTVLGGKKYSGSIQVIAGATCGLSFPSLWMSLDNHRTTTQVVPCNNQQNLMKVVILSTKIILTREGCWGSVVSFGWSTKLCADWRMDDFHPIFRGQLYWCNSHINVLSSRHSSCFCFNFIWDSLSKKTCTVDQ